MPRTAGYTALELLITIAIGALLLSLAVPAFTTVVLDDLGHQGVTADERLKFGFRLATARPPESREMEVLTKVLDEQATYFRGSPDSAAKLLAVGTSAFSHRVA